MADSPAVPSKGEQSPVTKSRTVAQIFDPSIIRAKVMLETASHMMTEGDWPYRAATVSMVSQGDETGSYTLFGANNPNSLRDVFERKVDISILNPGAILSMADRGVGVFAESMQVALIAVLPHYDQLAFAVSAASGLTSLDDIREKQYPLRLSVRGSLDACTTLLVEKVLQVHGFSFDDLRSWGGSVSYDQSMPNERVSGASSRIDRVANDELDAIFEEGVMVWANQASAIEMRFLNLSEQRLAELEREGFERGTIEKSRFASLPADVRTIDFSGWPIYTRVDASHLLVRKFCEALEARKDNLPWSFGPVKQKPMPLDRMVNNSPETPVNVAFHPAARGFWTRMGYLKPQ